LLPLREQGEDSLIPERQVSEDAGDRPPRGHGSGKIGIAQSADEGPKPATLGIVLDYVGAIRTHGVLLFS
jgi:hypothetical protein